MKKIAYLFVLMACMFALSSCENNTPQAVVKQALTSMQAGDTDNVVDLMGDKNGNALSKEQSDNIKSLFRDKATKRSKIQNFEVKDAEVAEDGKSAVVHYTITTEGGKQSDEKMSVLKGDDGKWRLSMKK